MVAQISKLTYKTLVVGSTSLLLFAAGCISTGGPTEPAGPTPQVFDPQMLGAPPPISGGTLLITSDNQTAVAADPDRESVWLVDLQKRQVRSRIQLGIGNEPGRVVEDGDGKVHVALRRGGAVLKIDPQSATIESTRAVCAAPRGLAYDKATGNLHVACAGGELVTMKARGGDVARNLQLDRDLRDVVVKGDHLLVSRFRSAELLDLDASGTEVKRLTPRSTSGMGSTGMVTASPSVAWRLVALPGDEVVMLHQRSGSSVVSTRPGGYGNGNPGCKSGGIASGAVTTYRGTMSGNTTVGDGAAPGFTSLAVDIAVSPDGQQMAVVGPLSDAVALPGNTAVVLRSDLGPTDPCTPVHSATYYQISTGELTAAAYDGAGQVYVQSREPAQIMNLNTSEAIPFDTAENRTDTGHRLFHQPTAIANIACASCHPEAGEDGHIWTFDTIGPRRTQDLRGGILATAPFHWDGDQTDITMLMKTVFLGRMAGKWIDQEEIEKVSSWLDAQQQLPTSPPRDAGAVARGDVLFHDAAVGCASCHSGAHFTSNQTVDVGTGKALQVPSLRDLASRAPYIHTGCAKTLRDRFDPTCGGGDRHGTTSQLTSNQIDDLVAYLQTL